MCRRLSNELERAKVKLAQVEKPETILPELADILSSSVKAFIYVREYQITGQPEKMKSRYEEERISCQEVGEAISIFEQAKAALTDGAQKYVQRLEETFLDFMEDIPIDVQEYRKVIAKSA